MNPRLPPAARKPGVVPELVLVSHALCPYVQRAAIVLAEKDVPHARREVDLAAKPAWFTAISPLGKTPVLLAGGTPVFESAVICDYLDETLAPQLHPVDPLARAQHRSWVEFASAVLHAVAGFYGAADAQALEQRRAALAALFAQVEKVLEHQGPYFAGGCFSMVDAAFAPAFRYFEVLEAFSERGFFEGLPRVAAWRQALAQRPSVRQAVRPDYAVRLEQFLRGRGSELSRRMARSAAPAMAH